MKHSFKTLFIALFAMFAFTTTADAQKAKLTIPTAGSGPEITFTRKDSDGDVTEVAKWNPATCEITVGDAIYKLDTKTGQVTDASGEPKGSMSAKGTIESPNFGKLDLVVDGVLVYVNKDGERLGAMVSSMGEIYYGARNKGDNGFASDKTVSPLLMTYIFYGLIYTQDDLDIKAGKKPKVEKIKYKPYNASEPVQEDYVRTIFTMPGTGEKMMLDVRCSQQGNIMSLEQANGRLTNNFKDEAFIQRCKKDFERTHKQSSINYAGPSKQNSTPWKIGGIASPNTGWEYTHDTWGNITHRYIRIYILFECEDGENIMAPYVVFEQNSGGSNYDEDTLIWQSSGWEAYNNYKPFSVNGWEVKTDCYTSTLTGK